MGREAVLWEIPQTSAYDVFGPSVKIAVISGRDNLSSKLFDTLSEIYRVFENLTDVMLFVLYLFSFVGKICCNKRSLCKLC